MSLLLLDEFMGETCAIGELRFLSASVSIRELIRARVELEVEQHRDQSNLARRRSWAPVVPEAKEVALNGDRGVYGPGSFFLKSGENGQLQVDAARLVADAEDGFACGRYFILVDDRQAEGLDEVIDLAKTTEATFLLLTPLKGG